MAEVGLEVDLRRTLLAGGLTLYYQPIVDLATGRPEGVEALVRWHHPTRGLLGPDQFVGLAERAGLSDDLTRWVLGAALDDQSAFEQEVGRPLHIAVNVGPPSVTSRLPLLVDEALAQRSVPPGRMTVEVTETALFSAADDPAGVLAALRSAGVSVALDDFGTGFSSLSLLARMPVDVVKVDRSFVSRIEGAGDELALVRGLLQLCRTLRIRSVAEGVETQSQAELLLAMGADLAQGYLYARPMPREDVCRWLAERSPGRPVPAARRSGSGGPQPPAR
ncbi:MAG: EAL domain-containing protein [Candidatus Nanopelagicales bacterium]